MRRGLEFSCYDIADALRLIARQKGMSPTGVKFHESLADAIEMVKPDKPLHDLLAIILLERSMGRDAQLATFLDGWVEAHRDSLGIAVDYARHRAETLRSRPANP